MVKRERPSSPVSSEDSHSTLTPYDSTSMNDEKPSIAKKKIKVSPKREKTRSGSTKTPWSVQEDEALLSIMEDLIRTHLWQSIRSSGNSQLIQRGSYGAQYHAKLLLKQGKLSSHKK